MTALTSDFLCGYVRFLTPIRAMVEQQLCEADVIFPWPPRPIPLFDDGPLLTQREFNLGPQNMAQARAHRAHVVHDMDDMLWAVPADNVNANVITAEVKANMFAAMRAADLVTVSTEPLRAEVEKLGVRATVVPNLIREADWRFAPARRKRQKLRVGWQGQVHVHNADLAVIDEAVRTLGTEVEWVFFGALPASMGQPPPFVEYYPPVYIDLFPVMLAQLDLDVMLSPLAPGPFNEAKSNIRVLHAAACGYAVIASDIYPHRGMPVTLVQNRPEAWVQAIRAHAAEPEATRRSGEALRTFAWQHYSADRLAPRILEIWRGRAT